ncbi:hypothetical protein HYPSUDRAFT_67296 [Hypholoma sublateritium FD-334 SS-4]|uniref:Uncharacterized protein n=1 Tax=Hypholoma sublateritium (strain FD-334 SS-4) TaxID=945553 RepID=A0A0D2P0I1_HYPSF|nr:hypothetical protein HYPSUDRAFT_67296 [Hypholoma sublateritium FD-334 SS-4]
MPLIFHPFPRLSTSGCSVRDVWLSGYSRLRADAAIRLVSLAHKRPGEVPPAFPLVDTCAQPMRAPRYACLLPLAARAPSHLWEALAMYRKKANLPGRGSSTTDAQFLCTFLLSYYQLRDELTLSMSA